MLKYYAKSRQVDKTFEIQKEAYEKLTNILTNGSDADRAKIINVDAGTFRVGDLTLWSDFERDYKNNNLDLEYMAADFTIPDSVRLRQAVIRTTIQLRIKKPPIQDINFKFWNEFIRDLGNGDFNKGFQVIKKTLFNGELDSRRYYEKRAKLIGEYRAEKEDDNEIKKNANNLVNKYRKFENDYSKKSNTNEVLQNQIQDFLQDLV